MSETTSTPAPAAERVGTPWVRLLLLVACTIAAYANSCRGPFIFDDRAAIENNATIRSLRDLRTVLAPRAQSTVAGRPVLNLSLAVNHALGGLDPRGYHVVNLVIHLCAGLFLFGLVRRALRTGALRERYGASADAAAFATSLLWLVHPIQTESVTYVIQRAESLMGLFYLAALYAFVRSLDSARAGGWRVFAVACAWLAAGTKEVAATIPLAVLVFDVVLNNASVVASLRKRPAFYGALALGWLVTLGLLIADPRGLSRVKETIGPFQYLINQPRVIFHYLRLVFWPRPLVLDYGEPAATAFASLLPGVLGVAALVFVTVGLLWRKLPAALPLVLFFLVLAPTSSVVPQIDLIFEHRMYLPLACVILLLVVPIHRLLLRAPLGVRTFCGAILLAVPVIGLGVMTHLRNKDYKTAVTIFADTVAKRPACARAQLNLGEALHAEGRFEEAQAPYLTAIKLNPKFVDAYYNSGLLLLDGNDPKTAVQFLARAVALDPKFAAAHNSLGSAYARQGMKEEAQKQFDEALRLDPNDADAHANAGNLSLDNNDLNTAREHFERALELSPEHSGALAGLGTVFARDGKLSDAVHYLTRAVRNDPKNSPAQVNLKLAEDALTQQRADAIKAAASQPRR